MPLSGNILTLIVVMTKDRTATSGLPRFNIQLTRCQPCHFDGMIKNSFAGNGTAGLDKQYPLNVVNPEVEPDLGFTTNWRQDFSNQSALLENFWAHVKEEESLVFFYAKQVPLMEDMPGRTHSCRCWPSQVYRSSDRVQLRWPR